ncbi:MAG: 4Fe-4S dicluster domain-containing protein [Promethearchaeota archaeon]|nr:MAG: 4Fe-4S dicluster domain-containing protein [Candidatus Lokiarchaeota archaeon]
MKQTSLIYNLKKEEYKRFPEQDHCIYRSLYDPEFKHFHKTLRTGMEELVDSGKKGYSRVDLALAAASWTINKHMPFAYKKVAPHSPQDYIPLPVKERPPEDHSPELLSRYIKRAAHFFGASLVGITKLDSKWLYKTKVELYSTSIQEKQELKFPELNLPDNITHAIIMIIEMDHDGINCAPTFLEFAAAGLGYSKMSFLIACMAQFIRNLGYEALPCANDTALSIPLAIDAGLGALGRIGLLITKDFGPRIRICKVLTNMPLEEDDPDVDFITQIQQKCQHCQLCAKACEYDAISFAKDPDYEIKSKSNNPGVQKWYVDAEKCYKGWIENCTDCALCIKACPYSKISRKITPEEFWKL